MEAALLTEFITRRKEQIILRWSELWTSIQKQRPESIFPDPPYEAILAQLPYNPAAAPPINPSIIDWFSKTPIFCAGAAFCQLHATAAHLLIMEQYGKRTEILDNLEDSVEALILDCGTHRWISNMLTDASKQEAVRSERLAVIGQLAAGIAHEIGNPLTSISSIAQVLRRRTDDPFFEEQLQSIGRNIDRIALIVRELVDFSRPAMTPPLAVQLNDVLRTAIDLVGYDKRSKSIDIETSYGKDLPFVLAVPDQLLQVFLNILINAVDAIQEKGRISVRTIRSRDRILTSIEDTGAGIPEEMLPRIFDPFFTTKPPGKGTGLGLSVSYGIVSRYNGTILVRSKPGQGSVFTVDLPVLNEQ